jgi:hypothetical protein
MFIKFSDKTKKIIVKTSKEGYDSELEDGVETINLYKNKDNKDVDNRRIDILNTYLNNDKEE